MARKRSRRGSKAAGRRLGARSRACKGLKKRAFYACLRRGTRKRRRKSRR